MSDLAGSIDIDDSLAKAIEQTYSGSGKKKEKEKTSDKAKDVTQVDDLPKEPNPESIWKKPIVEVYPDFTKWIDKWYNVMEYRRNESKNDLRYEWYKSGSDITILDRKDFKKKLFDTKGIQDKYKLYLDGKIGVNGDPIGIKFQTGNIMADERAFYIRHATIPRLMANGVMRNMQYEFLKEIYLNHIKKLREYEDDNYTEFHKDRYKGDANGKNSKK